MPLAWPLTRPFATEMFPVVVVVVRMPGPDTEIRPVTGLARSCGMAFIVLFADDRLYTRNGSPRGTILA